MPDFGSPVAQNVNIDPNKGLQTLSTLMSLRKQQADLSDQMNARAAIANAPSNPDGTIDQNAVQQALLRKGGLIGAQQATGFANAATANTQSQAASYHFTKEQGQDAMSAIGGVVNDPRMVSGDPEKVAEALSEAEDNMNTAGVPKAKAKLAMSQFYSMAKTDPNNVRNAIRNMTLGQQGAAGQYGAGSPNVAMTPSVSGTTPVNVNANLPTMPAGAAVGPATAPPNQLVPTMGGGTASANTASGVVRPLMPVPGGQSPQPLGQSPQQPAPVMDMPPGDKQALDTLSAEREAARAVVQQAPTNHYTNQAIHELVTGPNATVTGIGAEGWRNLSSRLGYSFGNDESTRINSLNALLERSGMQAAQSIGLPHTNAGLEAAKQTLGTTATDPKTIAYKADLNEALLNGAEGYSAGLEKAIANAGGNVLAKRQFDQLWANTLDVKAPMYGVIQQRDGQQAANDWVTKNIGPLNSPEVQAFKKKLTAIGNLQRYGTLQPPAGSQ